MAKPTWDGADLKLGVFVLARIWAGGRDLVTVSFPAITRDELPSIAFEKWESEDDARQDVESAVCAILGAAGA
jgi:hypothetical protein